jgi:glycosyltransferase involved in cell wall biosynthesis
MSVLEGGPRVIGVAIPDVRDWREPIPAGKWSQFFAAVDQRLPLSDVVQAKVSRPTEVLNLARHFYPARKKWLANAGFNLGYAAARSAVVKHALARREGDHDLVVQLQTLCAPSLYTRAPYAIYTDNTFALTMRVYPQMAPLSAQRARQWCEFEADICRTAAVVFTFSEFARSSVVDDYGCSPDRVLAIGAGANQMQSSLGDKRYDRPVALFVGGRFELKGGPSLLKAWALVLEQIPEAELVIAGPRGRPPRGLLPGVKWLGWVDRARLTELYRDATVFVLPSMFDAWGHVFVEAMGHGLPCIGTNCCAMPEIIEDGATGRLVSRADHEQLAAALCELLGDTNRAQTMGTAAHARIVERFTWGHVGQRFMEGLKDAGRLRAA